MSQVKHNDDLTLTILSKPPNGADGFRPSVRKKNLANAQSFEIGKVTDELRAALPILQPFQVRRYHGPYYEAILRELKEDGYQCAGNYLKELFDLDEEIKQKSGPGTLIWERSYLKDNKEFVNFLKNNLMECEEAARRKDYSTEANVLLDIAVFFNMKTWEWWWIAERVYQKALTIAIFIQNDHSYTITLARYLFGSFLFEKLKYIEEAIEYLNLARSASEKRVWNASRKLGRKENSIFKECNIILFKALVAFAREIELRDPEAALKACETALERAKETTEEKYIIEALHELGKCHLEIGAVESALKSFSRFLAMAKRIPDPHGICDAHKELALAYKKLNDNIDTEKHLALLRECAMQFELTDKLAEAHYCTGEHFLSNRQPELATKHLETAFELFYELNMAEDADRARSIAGISKAQERIREYENLILRSGKPDKKAILKICRWKNRRIEFDVKISDDGSDNSEYSLYEDFGTVGTMSKEMEMFLGPELIEED